MRPASTFSIIQLSNSRANGTALLLPTGNRGHDSYERKPNQILRLKEEGIAFEP